MRNCGNCSSQLKFANTPLFSSGIFSKDYELCTKCYTQLARLDKSANISKFTEKEVKEKLVKTEEILNRIQNNNVTPKIVDVNIDITPIEILLNHIPNISSISEIDIWDKDAISKKELITEYITSLEFANNQIKEEIAVSTGFNPFKNIFTKSKIESRNENFLKQYKNVVEKLKYLDGQLDYWINISPNSISELNDMKSELKQKQQLFTIRKKELNLGKKQAWANYRQNAATVEFVSPKLRHFYRGINMKQRESDLNPFDIELDNISLQLIEIEKLMIWLNKIK